MSWGESVPPIIFLLSVQLIVMLPDIYRVMKEFREGKMPSGFLYPSDINRWLTLYKHSEWVGKHLFRGLVSDFGTKDSCKKEIDRNINSLLSMRRVMSRMCVDDFKKVYESDPRRVLKEVGEIRDDIYQDACEIVKDVDSDTKYNDAFLIEWTSCDEFKFFVQVTYPCLFYYGKWPGFLYRKARQGDVESIHDLLRLDKSLMYDKHIACYILGSHYTSRRSRFAGFAKAIQGKPKKPLNPKSMRMSVAGMMKYFAAGFGYQLEVPKARELFDLFTMLQEPQQCRDQDLPINDDTMRQAINRSLGSFDLVGQK